MPKTEPVRSEVTQELVYLLRRIENDVEPTANIERLWKYCARHQIDSDYLLALTDKALLYPKRVLVALAESETSKAASSDEKKICVVTCVNNERQYEECLLYLQHAHLPEGFSIEYVPIYGAKSRTGRHPFLIARR